MRSPIFCKPINSSLEKLSKESNYLGIQNVKFAWPRALKVKVVALALDY